MFPFVLRQDNSSHWYLIPYDRVDDWNRWSELDEDDEASWDAPEWATPVNGSPCRIVFTGTWSMD